MNLNKNNCKCSFLIKFIPFYFLVILILPNCAFGDNIIRVSSLINNSKDNILYVEKLPKNYSKLIVDVNCDLNNKELILPLNTELAFDNEGYIDNGIICGNNSVLSVKEEKEVIGLNSIITGYWSNSEIYDTWFDFNNSPKFVSNNIINNVLSLTNDDTFCRIYFKADREYFFKLPYEGEANIGDMVSYKIIGNKKQRRYSDFYEDKFSFLRIFTIPSNTHITIQNKFKMLPTNVGAYFIFWQYGKKNITIDGNGVILGDVKEHIYNSPFVKGSKYYGEWGHIFCCMACSDFTFKDITIGNAFGDCISFVADCFSENAINRNSTNLIVDNVTIKYARRNGITVNAKNVIIKNSIFQSCGIDSIKGTAPRAAVDFESDGIRIYPETGNENVLMTNCKFLNNRYDISSTFNNLANFNKIATIISDCKFTAPLRLNTTNWIEFDNCIIPCITNYQDKITEKNPIRHIIFRNCIIKDMPLIIKTKSWDNSFYECKILK